MISCLKSMHERYQMCIDESIKAYKSDDINLMNHWDDNAREQYRQIEQLEKAQKELKSIRNDREIMERIVAYYEKA